MKIFVHNDSPGRRVFVPFKSCPGFVGGGGGGLDEIDICISHSQVKSDMLGPRQSTKLSMQVLKCVEFFELQSSYGSKRF